MIETSAGGLPIVRAALRALRNLDGWEAILLRTARLAARPSIPLGLRDRVHLRTAVRSDARAELLRDAAIVVPSPDGLGRLRAEAAAAGCALVEPPGVEAQPELAAAGLLRFAEDDEARQRDADARRAAVRESSFDHVASDLERAYAEARGRRRAARAPRDGAARRPRMDRHRPAHAHPLVARLLDRAGRRSSTTPSRRASEPSR